MTQMDDPLNVRNRLIIIWEILANITRHDTLDSLRRGIPMRSLVGIALLLVLLAALRLKSVPNQKPPVQPQSLWPNPKVRIPTHVRQAHQASAPRP